VSGPAPDTGLTVLGSVAKVDAAPLPTVGSASVIARRWFLLALVAASATGCGAAGAEPTSSDPHEPRSDDERFLAARYREFVRALERHDSDGVCRYLDRRLAESYGCGAGSRLSIPRELQRIEVPMTDVFAAADPAVPDEIQISARSRRSDGGRLILFFRRSRADEWRINQTMIGWYG